MTVYSRQTGAERLIATARVVLAAFSLVATWLDPPAPSSYAGVLGGLLSGYLVYALLVAAAVWTSPTPPVRLGLLTHVFDLTVFTLFMYFTVASTSPFFVYFLFSLLCATLRWRWRGTVWTMLAALSAFLALAVWTERIVPDAGFDLNRVIIRGVYLLVMAGLLVYLAAYEDRLGGKMSQLVGWPGLVPEDGRALLTDLLSHAAEILGAPRVLMAWAEPEEPWLHLAIWEGGQLRWTRESPETCQPLVPEPLSDSDFFCLESDARTPEVLRMTPSGLQRWNGVPLHQDLRERFAIRSVLSVSLQRDNLEGRLLVLDRPGLTQDDLIMGQLVGRQIASRLNHFYLVQRLKQAAAAEERVRLARDLHDGLLQSLTGVALHLQAARRILETQPRVARTRLREVQRVIAAEQADLRAFVRQLKPRLPRGSETAASLIGRLHQFGQRITRQWGVNVEMKADHLDMSMSEPLAHDIYRIVQEAVVNAARHAEASAVCVEIALNGEAVRISVTDNGRGFPFRGQYDLASLTAMNEGPATLKERVQALGGGLLIDSTESGAHLDISLPLAEPRA